MGNCQQPLTQQTGFQSDKPPTITYKPKILTEQQAALEIRKQLESLNRIVKELDDRQRKLNDESQKLKARAQGNKIFKKISPALEQIESNIKVIQKYHSVSQALQKQIDQLEEGTMMKNAVGIIEKSSKSLKFLENNAQVLRELNRESKQRESYLNNMKQTFDDFAHDSEQEAQVDALEKQWQKIFNPQKQTDSKAQYQKGKKEQELMLMN